MRPSHEHFLFKMITDYWGSEGRIKSHFMMDDDGGDDYDDKKCCLNHLSEIKRGE